MNYSNINDYIKVAPVNTIREFNDRISHIEDLMYFNIGEPDFATPLNIKEAAINSINQDQSFYSHSRGVLELRQAISDYLNRKYHLNYSPQDQILVTAGATQALYIALTGLINPGDEVLVVDPNYIIYNTQVILAGGVLKPIDVSTTGFKLTVEILEKAISESQKAKAIILNYPTNPTGVTYTAEEIKAFAKVIKDNQLYVISDEVYSEFSYEEAHISIATFIPERTLLINGTSKSHAMTGWRSAFLAGPSELIEAFYALHQAMLTAITTQVQYASIAAYKDSDASIIEMYNSYKQRCELIYEGLNELAFESVKPAGAFYIFTKLPEWFKGNDVDFCLALAHDAKLAVTPGSIFGEAGRGYFRTSYVSSLENIKIYLDRLKKFKEKYQEKM